MKRALHISPNSYKSIDDASGTKAIWIELSKDYDEYHILARSVDNRSHEYTQGKLHLHLVPGFWRPMSFFVTSYFGLSKLIKKYSYEILICQCSILGGFWAVRNFLNLPVLMEIHGIFYFSYLGHNDLKSRLLKPVIRYSFEHATAVRSLNEKMTQRLREEGIRNKNIFEVYNRVDMELFRSERNSYELHDPIRLISIGNFVDSKDHLNLFHAIYKLMPRYNIHVTVIGGGPMKNKYESFVEKHGLDAELIDHLPQEELVKRMDESDIYVHSSWREGMPRTILEAMAMKLPVVATAAGFTEGTVNHEKNGLVVPTKDPERLAEAIKHMIEDNVFRERCALQGYQNVLDKYEWNKCFKKYRELLIKTEELGRS